MVAYKASQLRSYLSRPDPAHSVALFYGPDPALVSDNAASLAKVLAARSQPAGDIIRLGEKELADNPGLLAIETQTISMFGGTRVVRATAGQRFPEAVLEELLDQPLEAFLIVEAGNLRPGAKLRKLIEGSKRAAALPCYELSRRDMGAFIEAELSARGVSADRDAREHLSVLFGGDQARARGELEKLALYAGDGGNLTLEDIDAVIGDVAQAALDSFSVAAANRDRRSALRHLDRLIATGQSPQGAIAALARHFERLHRLCGAVEGGDDIKSALSGFKPPLHFRQRDALEAQARKWSRREAAKVLVHTAKATEMARLNPELERALTERLVIAIGN